MYYNITLVYILIMFVFVDMPYIFVIHIFSPHVLIYSLSEGLARNTPYDTKSWRWKKKVMEVERVRLQIHEVQGLTAICSVLLFAKRNRD